MDYDGQQRTIPDYHTGITSVVGTDAEPARNLARAKDRRQSSVREPRRKGLLCLTSQQLNNGNNKPGRRVTFPGSLRWPSSWVSYSVKLLMYMPGTKCS